LLYNKKSDEIVPTTEKYITEKAITVANWQTRIKKFFSAKGNNYFRFGNVWTAAYNNFTL